VLYLYHKEAGIASLTLTGDEHRYLFKVRRHKAGESLALRNLEDRLLYTYRIEHLDRRSAVLHLCSQTVCEVKAKTPLHIGWCVIDPKSVEKVLPSLNEMGVEQITFIYCQRSQKSFTLDFKRLEKILLNSSQQSGRSTRMKLAMAQSLEAFLLEYPQSKLVNFSKCPVAEERGEVPLIIGCEGGFSEEEVARFSSDRIVGFDTPLVLRSESAVCAVASKVLL